jgi:hypothetical protein
MRRSGSRISKPNAKSLNDYLRPFFTHDVGRLGKPFEEPSIEECDERIVSECRVIHSASSSRIDVAIKAKVHYRLQLSRPRGYGVKSPAYGRSARHRRGVGRDRGHGRDPRTRRRRLREPPPSHSPQPALADHRRKLPRRPSLKGERLISTRVGARQNMQRICKT